MVEIGHRRGLDRSAARLLLDRFGHVSWANRTACNFMLKTPNQVRGKNFCVTELRKEMLALARGNRRPKPWIGWVPLPHGIWSYMRIEWDYTLAGRLITGFLVAAYPGLEETGCRNRFTQKA